MRRYYPKLHQLIAVSQGVADDVITITGMSDTSGHGGPQPHRHPGDAEQRRPFPLSIRGLPRMHHLWCWVWAD